MGAAVLETPAGAPGPAMGATMLGTAAGRTPGPAMGAEALGAPGGRVPGAAMGAAALGAPGGRIAGAFESAGAVAGAIDGAAVLGADGVGRAAGGATCGGGTLIRACCSTCGATRSAAGATLAALVKVWTGTTVAAARFAKFWATARGGRPSARWVMFVILAGLTLARLTLRM